MVVFNILSIFLFLNDVPTTSTNVPSTDCPSKREEEEFCELLKVVPNLSSCH